MRGLRCLDGLGEDARKEALDSNIWDEVIAILVPWLIALLTPVIPWINVPIIGAIVYKVASIVLTYAFELLLKWFGLDTVQALIQGNEAAYSSAKDAFSAVMNSNGGQDNAAVQSARAQFKVAILGIIAKRGLTL